LLLTTLQARADEGLLFTADKMSSSSISCVTQDSYGFVWVGTDYGLNRFDGYQFGKYYTNSDDTTSIVSNEVTSFLVDSRQQLWIGCRKGVVRYLYESDSFQRYYFPEGIEPRVIGLLEDPSGIIIIGTSGYGIFILKTESGQIVRPKGFSRQYVDDFIGSIFEDDRHQLWCSNVESKLKRFTIEDMHPMEMKEYETNCGSVVSFVKHDQRGFYVVCMYGILYYDYQNETLTPADLDLSVLSDDMSIRCAILSNNGNLYLGTSGMGLMTIPRGSRKMQQVDNLSENFDLQTANIGTIFQDRSRNLWIGCHKRGLFQIRRGHGAFSSWRFASQGYAIGSNVSSITPGDNGDVLCVVLKSGLWRFDQNGKIQGKLRSPDAPTVIFRDRQNRYWLATENSLYEYNPTTQTSVLMMRDDGWGVNCISDDDDGCLFLANDGKGLTIFDTKTRQSRTFSMYETDEQKGTLVNNWIRALYYDSKGLLWIGTVDGLGCMIPHEDNFKPLGWDYQFKGFQCYSLLEMPDGNMLIGTEIGLYIFNRLSGQFSLFADSKELQNKSINSIVADHSGDLWMSTADGIWHYNRQEGLFDNYVHGDGLMASGYVVGAKITYPDGRIMFGNYDGITMFYPQNVKGRGAALGDVSLSSFIVDGQRMDCRKRHFDLSSDDNSFVLEFSLFDFHNNDNITFLYRINDSEDWVPLSDGSNAVSFFKMKPGTYNIEVKAISRGLTSNTPCLLQVVVHSPWYLSWWAYLIYSLLLLGLIAIAAIYYEHFQKEELEEAKMRFLINATHDIRSPLTLIFGPLKKLKSKVATLSDSDTRSEMTHYMDIIDSNAQRLLLLVNQILDERRIDKDQLILKCQETDLVQFIQNVCNNFQYHAQQRNISFTFDHTDPKVLAWIDHSNFDKVLSNLLSNAFKYTFDRGSIKFVLSQNEQNACIQLIDSGIGFKEENTDKLFERFYQGANARGIISAGSGIGLNLSRSIVQLHGGTIKAYNRTDGQRGACIEVQIPLGNKHLKPESIVTTTVESSDTAAEEQRHQPNKNYRILIVDDEPEISRFIASELGTWYHFDIVTNGKEALNALFAENYDLVISDIIMPEMDGITLLKNIKNVPQLSDIPVILLTSKSEVEHRLSGIRNGADSYISKPFNMDELHVQIDNLIDNVRRLRGKFTGALDQEDKVEKIEVKGNNDALMDRIIKVINENLNDSNFNVEQLTKEVGISRAQLHRKMKEITGVSTGDFIRNLRLQQAERLIRENKINVTQVAYTVGFNNQSHFSTVFRKYYGMTPSEYAAKHAETQPEKES
jgi:signal transduction histidine kinase/DNA-binding response OmpR family regulator/ligand-binding sensor domain-containing protein